MKICCVCKYTFNNTTKSFIINNNLLCETCFNQHDYLNFDQYIDIINKTIYKLNDEIFNKSKNKSLSNESLNTMHRLLLNKISKNKYIQTESEKKTNIKLITIDDFKDININLCTNEKTQHNYIQKKNIRNINKIKNKKIRKKILKIYLNKMKFKYLKNPISEAFIKYGKPDFQFVMEKYENQNTIQNTRMCELLEFLDINDFEYNSQLSSLNTYIKNGGILKNTLDDAKFELYLIENSDFLELKQKYDEETAKDKAIISYLNNGGNNIIAKNYFKNKISINFD
jgi:hypothetical protein